VSTRIVATLHSLLLLIFVSILSECIGESEISLRDSNFSLPLKKILESWQSCSKKTRYAGTYIRPDVRPKRPNNETDSDAY
jgi:hypothetical protein